MSHYLRLFGGVRLDAAQSEPVKGRAAHRRRLALLALLAHAWPRGVSRERAVTLLWPDLDAERGRRQLSEGVYLLRRQLGEEAIASVGDTLVLNQSLVPSDLQDYRQALADGRLPDAVAAQGAPFLDGWYVDDAPEFERWSSEVRDELTQSLRDALSTLATAAEGAGAWDDAVRWLARLARLDPYSPQPALRLVAAHERLGEFAAALQVLTRHRTALRDELALDVSAEITKAEERLRAAAAASSDQPSGTSAVPVRAIPAPPAASAQEGQPASTAPVLDRPAPRAGNVSAFRWIGFALVPLLLAAGAWLVWPDREPPPPGIATQGADRGGDPHHVAVLYFDDHSAGRTLGYLADGLTEELIHQLTRVRALRVVSRHGVKRFRDTPLGIDSVAAALRVGSIVEGSVQRSGDSLRVTVQLIDARTGLHEESIVVQRPMRELFAVEQEIAVQLAAALRRRLGSAVELAQVGRGTESQEAVELVLRARALQDDAERIGLHPHENDARSARGLLAQGDSVLQLAERRDARWVRPVLDRAAGALLAARLSGGDERRRALQRAEAHAERVLRRAPAEAEALQVRGIARWRQVAGDMRQSADSGMARAAEADLRQAVALDSTLARAWSILADILSVRGAWAEAEVLATRALRQDAWLDGAGETYFFAFGVNYLMRRLDEARRWCNEGRRVFPESWRFVECELTLMRPDTLRPPDPVRAWALVARMDSLDPPDKARASGHSYSPIYRRALAAAVSARAGDGARARRALAEARAMAAGDSVLLLDLAFESAYVHLALGEPDSARTLLQRVVQARPMYRTQIARDTVLARVLGR